MTTRAEPLPAYAPEHPAFAGHFPGHPIVPGVLLLDAALHALGADAAGGCRIASAKFLRPVAPATALELQASVSDAGGWRFAVRDTLGEVTSGQVQIQTLTAEAP